MVPLLEAYDLDWLKLMNDYSYPMPTGVETFSLPADLDRVQPLDIPRTPLAAQLRVIKILAREVAGRVLLVDTVFNAWNTLRRSLVKDAMETLMRDHPRRVESALRAVNDTLIRYAQAAIDGAAGIFLSVHPLSPESPR